MRDRNYKPKVRDLAETMQGPLHSYLGHMQDPKYLRKGHNTDGPIRVDPDKARQVMSGFFGSTMGGAAPAPSPSPQPKK